MINVKRDIDWKIFFLLYLPLALITTYIHIRFTGKFGYEWGVFGRPNGHSAVIDGIAFAPTQYRILMPFCAEFIHQILKISIPDAYYLLRVMTTFLALLLFHVYLKRWFDTPKAIIGTLYLVASLPLSYMFWPYSADMFNLIIWTLGFIVIRDNKGNWLYPLLIIGVFNYEGIVFLTLVYFFYHFREMPFKKLILRTVSYLLVFGLIMFALRLRYGVLPNFMDNKVHLIGYPMYQFNLTMYSNLFKYLSWTTPGLFIFLLFGFFWILAFVDMNKKPKFLTKGIWIIPFYLIFHLFFASFAETRVFLPLFLLLIPSGLFSLFKEKDRD
ncbi:MAG: hypothetical protein ABIF11_11905 [Nitrospirota bacterium]